MNEKVVVIEDEPDILEVVRYNLAKEGFRVEGTADGERGLALLRSRGADLVILDLMLPGMDGLEVCRRLKADPGTHPIPVLMITAKGEDSDIILGLGVGADDYLPKPFSPKVLLARVRAVLRRGPLKQDAHAADTVERDGLVVSRERHRATCDGLPVALTATEFRLLHLLSSHPGRVFTRDRLVSRIMGEDSEVIERNIDAHVRSLRRKLGSRRGLIETVRGVGYRFAEPA